MSAYIGITRLRRIAFGGIAKKAITLGVQLQHALNGWSIPDGLSILWPGFAVPDRGRGSMSPLAVALPRRVRAASVAAPAVLAPMTATVAALSLASPVPAAFALLMRFPCVVGSSSQITPSRSASWP
jgi:hypothetical protein